MRLTFAVVLTALALAAGPARADWTSYTSPDNLFTIDVPNGPPTVEKKMRPEPDGSQVPLEIYAVNTTSPAMIVMVAHFDAAAHGDDAEPVYQKAIEGILSEGRTLISDKAETLDGHAGHTVMLRDAKGSGFCDRMFFVGDDFLQLITVIPADGSDDAAQMTNRFIQSLHFLK